MSVLDMPRKGKVPHAVKKHFLTCLRKNKLIFYPRQKKNLRVYHLSKHLFMNIAKDAGVSRSNLYNYFANKQELLSYLLENFKLSILSVIKK